MIFKIKNLMIRVVPPDREAKDGDRQCVDCSVCTDPCTGTCVCSYCSNPWTECLCTDWCTECTNGCTDWCTGCTNGCTDCTFSLTCREATDCVCTIPTAESQLDDCPEDDPERLANLKKQLKRQLAAIEAKEKAAETAMSPKTMKEVEDLERKITEALEELSRIKARLATEEEG